MHFCINVLTQAWMRFELPFSQTLLLCNNLKWIENMFGGYYVVVGYYLILLYY